MIKFGDYLSCQFIYFSLYHKHYIHKEAIGDHYKLIYKFRVFYLSEKIQIK